MRPFHYTVVMLARLGLVCGWLLVACSGAKAPLASPLAPRCGGEPTFDAPAPPLEPEALHLAASITVAASTIEAALERAVPNTLAHAKGQSMGAPGKVTYRVQRGPLRLVPSADALSVHTQLFADIDVCKPLGPVCLHYGACRPEWAVSVTVPLDVELDAPPSPRLELSLTEGCVLRPVGYDATAELERITREQARGARARIQRRVADGFEQWLSGLELARQGIRFGPSPLDCVSIEPTSFERTALEHEAGMLSLGFASRALARWGCDAREEREEREPYEGGASELPRMTVASELDPNTRLVVAEELAYDELTRRLEAPQQAVRFRAGLLSGQRRLFAGVSGVSDCEPEWVVVEPRFDGEHLRLVAVGVEGAPSQAAAWLQEHGRVRLSERVTRVLERVGELEAQWQGEAERNLGEFGLSLSGRLERFPHWEPGPESARLGVRLAGQLRVEPKPVER